jgi:hypothetical protein
MSIKQTMSMAAALAFCFATADQAFGETPYPIEWSRQVGSWNDDYGRSVAVDSANHPVVVGRTSASIDVQIGGHDAIIIRYNDAGVEQWRDQFGTTAEDYAYGVDTDAANNIYVGGYTTGTMGAMAYGSIDSFLRKYDATGTVQWTRQFGTSSGDSLRDVAVDPLGNAYLCGVTFGSMQGVNAGSGDAFLVKYDAAGNYQWARQMGTSTYDFARGAAVDGSGNIFVTGYTDAALAGSHQGRQDVFLYKYDPNGNVLWSRQFGTNTYDEAHDVAVDADGNAYITGNTYGSLDGTNAGGTDVFLAKYDPNGTPLWITQYGSDRYDYGEGVDLDALGGVFITGNTTGELAPPDLEATTTS